MTTTEHKHYSAKNNCIRAARKELGAQAQPGVDFIVAYMDAATARDTSSEVGYSWMRPTQQPEIDPPSPEPESQDGLDIPAFMRRGAAAQRAVDTELARAVENANAIANAEIVINETGKPWDEMTDDEREAVIAEGEMVGVEHRVSDDMDAAIAEGNEADPKQDVFRPTLPELDGKDAEIERIAREFLGFPTLAVRGSDSLDFRECGVNVTRLALEAAYEAGRASVKASTEKPARKPREAKERAPRAAGGESKKDLVARLLQRPEGCTTAEVLAATGWPAVSMPQQARSAGLELRQEKDGRVTRYYGAKAA